MIAFLWEPSVKTFYSPFSGQIIVLSSGTQCRTLARYQYKEILNILFTQVSVVTIVRTLCDNWQHYTIYIYIFILWVNNDFEVYVKIFQLSVKPNIKTLYRVLSLVL